MVIGNKVLPFHLSRDWTADVSHELTYAGYGRLGTFDITMTI